jgi:hypothetical protein
LQSTAAAGVWQEPDTVSDEHLFFAGYRRPRSPFRPGDKIRVKCGPLAHATGVVERMLDSQRCVIALNGIEPGVSVILDAATLELADPLSC